MNEKVQNSIKLASSYLELDHESIIILDDVLGIWIAYITINSDTKTKALLFANDDRFFGISETAENKLRDWILGQ